MVIHSVTDSEQLILDTFQMRSKSVEDLSIKESIYNLGNKKYTSTDDLINTGLSLAGSGLNNDHIFLNKNFKICTSTQEEPFQDTITISSSGSTIDLSDIMYNPNVMPTNDLVVDHLFKQLLEDKSFFWGSANVNNNNSLNNISKRRKWALICKMHGNENQNLNDDITKSTTDISMDQSTNSNSRLASNPIGDQLLITSYLSLLLNDDSKLAKTLYSLEKKLRQSTFLQYFIKEENIDCLASCTDKILPKSEYVFLKCFKRILNYDDGRVFVLSSSNIVKYFVDLMSSNDTPMKNKLLSTELLLLLTYVDTQLGYETVLSALNPNLENWLKIINNYLLNPNKIIEESQTKHAYIQFTNIDTMIQDYSIATLFLMNSIMQVLPNLDNKYKLINYFKQYGIHRIFHSMKQLDSEVIIEQINLYSKMEQDTIMAISHHGPLFLDISFGSELQLLVTQSQKTPLEQPIGQLLQSLTKITSSRTQSEAMKLFHAFESTLSYLIDNFYHGVDTEKVPETVIQSSINELMDKLQSDEIARRAMDEMAGLENALEKLKEEVNILKKEREMDAGEILGQLQFANLQYEKKDLELKNVYRKLQSSEEQRRLEKKRIDQFVTHSKFPNNQKITSATAGTSTVFIKLKNPYNSPLTKSSSRSLLKSKRISSLSSYVNTTTVSTTEFTSGSYSNNLTGKSDVFVNKPFNEPSLIRASIGKESIQENYSLSNQNMLSTDSFFEHDPPKFFSDDKSKMYQNGLQSTDSLPGMHFNNDVKGGIFKSNSTSGFQSTNEYEYYNSNTASDILSNNILASGMYSVKNDESRYMQGISTTSLFGVNESGRNIINQELINIPKRKESGMTDSNYGIYSKEYTSASMISFNGDRSFENQSNKLNVGIPVGNPTNTTAASQNGKLQPNLQVLPPPPPPPPPLPESLQLISSELSSINTNHLLLTLPPPLPNIPAIVAPPPLPDLLHNNKDTKVKSVNDKSIPPPPPLPENIKPKNEDDSNEKDSTVSDLPPPPPPAFLSNLTKPNTVRKLKQIHWDRVENIDETLWKNNSEFHELFKELEYTGVFNDIEDAFKINEIIKNARKNVESKEKSNLKSFLSRDLAQQFGINLHIFSQFSEFEFFEKVLNCDDSINQNSSVLEFFNKEDLAHISGSIARNYAPYGTDYLANEEPSKDSSELERADRIFLKLCYNLRSYWAERSQCLLALSTYEKDYYDLIFKLQKIDDAVQKLINSYRFHEFLYIILEIGNYMNKKCVSGVKIGSLAKLAFIKSTSDKNISFLHFIERLLRMKYPDVYGFIDDLSKIEDLGKVTLDHITIECQDFCTRINTAVYSVTKGKLSQPEKLHPKDKILQKVKYKISRAKTKSDLLKDQHKLTKHDLNKLMRYYGEDPNDNEARDTFFKSIMEFSLLFKKCAKENIEREESERVYEQRKNLLDSKTRKISSQDPEDDADEDRDAVDKLLLRLRGVEKNPEPLRRRRSTKLLSSTSELPYTTEDDATNLESKKEGLLERTQALISDIQKI